MPKFSQKSRERLQTCHPELQRLFNEVVRDADCSIMCGHRGKDEQEKAVAAGFSKVQYQASKHNSLPSTAVDVWPYPFPGWPDEPGIDAKENAKRWEIWGFFAGQVIATARQMGISIRWGGDWNGNLDLRDEKFRDLPHFELQ